MLVSVTSNLLGASIAGPILRKDLHKLSFEDIQKYPLTYSNKLIKKLIGDGSVPGSAKRWLKLSLYLRITSTVLFFSFFLFLAAYTLFPILK